MKLLARYLAEYFEREENKVLNLPYNEADIIHVTNILSQGINAYESINDVRIIVENNRMKK